MSVSSAKPVFALCLFLAELEIDSMSFLRKLRSVVGLSNFPDGAKKVFLFAEGNNHRVFKKTAARYFIEWKSTDRLNSVAQPEVEESIKLAQDQADGFCVDSRAYRDLALNNIPCDLPLTGYRDFTGEAVQYTCIQHSLNQRYSFKAEAIGVLVKNRALRESALRIESPGV